MKAKRMFGPYPGVVTSEHDGDTVWIALDFGFGVTFTGASCRVVGMNAPELKTPDGKPNPAGEESLAFAQTLVHVGDQVTVFSKGWDNYGGRYDGTITLPDGRDFAAVMIQSGHAVAKRY
jgi:endonuclease YncB( thermonuclease family)